MEMEIIGERIKKNRRIIYFLYLIEKKQIKYR